MSNLSQAKVTTSTDRSVYFPGEAIKLTLTVTNPTPQPLEIPDPNNPGTQRVRGCIADLERVSHDPANPPGAIRRDVPSVVLQPGQSITLTADTEDTQSLKRWCLGGFAAAGDTTVKFRLGGSATIRVGTALLEATAIVPLQEFKTYREEGMQRPETVQYAVLLIAAQLGNEHLVMAARHDVVTTYSLNRERDGALSHGDAVSGAPWIRLATASSKVTKLSGTADATGQITVAYTTEDGGGGTLYLDKNRHPL
jgi:hypothetical protein